MLLWAQPSGSLTALAPRDPGCPRCARTTKSPLRREDEAAAMVSWPRFSSCCKEGEGLAPFAALDLVGAPLSADVVRPRALKWADPTALVPRPRLVEPRVGGQPERNCANPKGNMSALFARTRFGQIERRGQPFIPAASATTVCFEPIPSVPIFEAEAAIRRRSSARRDLAMVRT